ncbi:MAG: MIP/aquaporin family protein [Ktedonobacterales bacterium]
MPEQPTKRDPNLTVGQRCAAEALGMFLLVLFHAGSSALVKLHGHTTARSLTVSDLAFLGLVKGGSLFFIIMALGKVSGVHINPAITLALASIRRFPWWQVPLYIVMQVIGAMVGAASLLVLFGVQGATVGHLGAPSLPPQIGPLRGMLIEALGTFVLMLTIRSTAEDKRAPAGWAGLAIPAALGSAVMLIEPLTGASLNPARAFGPDILVIFFGVPVTWLDFLVAYALGPILGALVAVVLYQAVATERAGHKPPMSQAA